MQFFTGKNNWPPDRSAASEKRKHDSVESSFDEEGRKKRKADGGVNEGDGNRRGSAESVHSPSSTSIGARYSPITQNSLPSPPIHPDRQQRLPPSTFAHHSTSKIYPPSPLSKSPEHSSDELAVDDPKPASTIHHPNPVWKADSRRLSNGSSLPQPLQIDTARAISDLDPRSPGYGMRRMAPEGSRDKSSSRQQGCPDADWSSSDPSSRRQSETMLPPPSAGIRLLRSESSTPNTSTPIAAKERMNPASDTLYPSDRKNSTSMVCSKSVNAKEVTLPKVAAPRTQTPLRHNFMGFAESIMSTTSVNIKLEHMKGLAIENVKESRRHEKHNVAYASLVDLTNANYTAIQKAKMRLEKQFERCNTNQDLIANAMEVLPAQPPVASSIDAAMDIGTEIPEELANLREDLREVRAGLADQRAKGVRQKDLERFARKTACMEDIEHFITKEELLDIVKKLSARPSDLQSLEMKVSNLADITNERHREAQETEKQYDKHLKDLDAEMSAARNTGQQRYTNTQTKLAEFGDNLGTLKEGSGMQTKLAELLEKSVDNWKEEVALLKEGIKQLRSDQASLKASVWGDSVNSEVGLDKLIEDASKEISQLKVLVEQLQEKMDKLEEGAAKDSASPRQPLAPTNDVTDPTGHIDGIRQDLTEVAGATDELKREFYEIADDVDKIRQGLTNLRDEYDRSKVGVDKQPLQSVQPAHLHEEATAPTHPSGPVNGESLDHVKLEKLESDLQALRFFTNNQQMRFDNLTTEDMTRSIIHQTKQLYKEHPGHVQDKLKILEEQQRNVDAYITGNLQPRLKQVDTHLGVRATTDSLKVLDSRVQALEANLGETNSQIVQGRMDLFKGITDVRRASIPCVEGPDSARSQENVITLREELKEVRSKHAELVKMVMTRHGKLRGDVQILNREIYTAAAGNFRKQAKLRGSLEYMDLIAPDLDDVEGTRRSKSVELNEATSLQSSNRQDTVANGLNGHGPVSDDESDTPMSQLQERKRKRRFLPKASDEEDDNDNSVRRRAAGKGPR